MSRISKSLARAYVKTIETILINDQIDKTKIGYGVRLYKEIYGINEDYLTRIHRNYVNQYEIFNKSSNFNRFFEMKIIDKEMASNLDYLYTSYNTDQRSETYFNELKSKGCRATINITYDEFYNLHSKLKRRLKSDITREFYFKYLTISGNTYDPMFNAKTFIPEKIDENFLIKMNKMIGETNHARHKLEEIKVLLNWFCIPLSLSLRIAREFFKLLLNSKGFKGLDYKCFDFGIELATSNYCVIELCKKYCKKNHTTKNIKRTIEHMNKDVKKCSFYPDTEQLFDQYDPDTIYVNLPQIDEIIPVGLSDSDFTYKGYYYVFDDIPDDPYWMHGPETESDSESNGNGQISHYDEYDIDYYKHKYEYGSD